MAFTVRNLLTPVIKCSSGFISSDQNCFIPVCRRPLNQWQKTVYFILPIGAWCVIRTVKQSWIIFWMLWNSSYFSNSTVSIHPTTAVLFSSRIHDSKIQRSLVSDQFPIDAGNYKTAMCRFLRWPMRLKFPGLSRNRRDGKNCSLSRFRIRSMSEETKNFSRSALVNNNFCQIEVPNGWKPQSKFHCYYYRVFIKTSEVESFISKSFYLVQVPKDA